MFKSEVLSRFLKYAQVDTMSIEKLAETIHPSFEGEWDLLRLLEKELRDLGLTDVELDKYGYLLARVPATDPSLPCIAFSSHVDTADDVMGNGVKPQLHENYDGGDIKLNDEHTIYAKDNPGLKDYIGTTIVTSDGTTLLGADDKAGIAEIMTAINYVIAHPEIKHGEIEILFSPDEETGYGMDFFDDHRLHCKTLYTMDGGTRYEIEAECFNAAVAVIKFAGISYHLGAARGRMVNAITMASTFINSLPQAESPEATDERYGYYCAHKINGDAVNAELTVYLRDFDYENLEYRIDVLKTIAQTVEKIYKGSKVTVEPKIQYKNMIEVANKNPKAMGAIFDAGKELGQPLVTKVIRGGTDGARIAEDGIPCPNIYVGEENMHSIYEWISVDAMNDATALIIEIIKQWAK